MSSSTVNTIKDLLEKYLDLIGSAPNSESANSESAIIIYVATAAICLTIATVPLALHREALEKEHWVGYFGWAFVTLGMLYILLIFKDDAVLLRTILSSVNNILFLAAALSLRDRLRVFPPWAVILAAVSVASGFYAHYFKHEEQATWILSFPDTALSVITILMLGWAMFTNIDPQWWKVSRPIHTLGKEERAETFLYRHWRIFHDYWAQWRKKIPASFTLLVALAYAAVLVVLGFSDLIAAWVQNSFLHRSVEELRRGIDLAVSIISFPLKLGLFASAIYLIVRSLIVLSPRAMSRMLDRVTRGDRMRFLSSEGIVETIARSLDADSVQLYFKRPGHSQRSVTCWNWTRVKGQSIPWEPFETAMPDESTITGWILAKGDLYKCQSLTEEKTLTWWEPPETTHENKSVQNPRIETAIAVPIQYHGQTIAGLNIGWDRNYSMISTALQRIRLIADLLSPTLETRRQLLAVSLLVRYFQSQEIVRPDVERVTSLVRLTHVTQTTLSPLVTAVSVDVGFTSAFSVCSRSENQEGEEFTNQESRGPCNKRFLKVADKEQKKLGDSSKVSKYSTRTESLTVEGVEVGTLFLAQPAPLQERNSPPFVGNWLVRTTIASMLADALFDVTRVRLWAILDRFQMALGNEMRSSETEWFICVERSAKEAGILWCVFQSKTKTAGSNPDQFFGERGAVQAIDELASTNSDFAECEISDGNSGESQESQLRHFPLAEPIENAHHIIRLKPTPSTILLLGIGRPGFAIELRKNWPWQIFLERFSIVAGASLTRIKLDQIRRETIHNQGLVTASVVTGTLVHQLGNMAANLDLGMQNLNEAVEIGETDVSSDAKVKVKELSDEITRLRKITSTINNTTKLDAKRPSHLSKAAKNARVLFETAAREYRIELQVEVSDEIVVDMPLFVTSLAIANLINNSIDAISKSESTVSSHFIHVQGKDLGGIVHCSVVDNGPGIPPGSERDIFELNYSTKNGSSGLGLYLARRTLRENGGDLILVESLTDRTEFNIILPKERPGESR